MKAVKMEFAQARTNVSQLANELKDLPSMNEADTRFQIIDRILFDCLGWPRSDVRLEKAQGQEYTDYELLVPPVAILEAKRSEIIFKIPVSRRPTLLRQVSSVASASPECAKALNQACHYSISEAAR